MKIHRWIRVMPSRLLRGKEERQVARLKSSSYIEAEQVVCDIERAMFVGLTPLRRVFPRQWILTWAWTCFVEVLQFFFLHYFYEHFDAHSMFPVYQQIICMCTAHLVSGEAAKVRVAFTHLNKVKRKCAQFEIYFTKNTSIKRIIIWIWLFLFMFCNGALGWTASISEETTSGATGPLEWKVCVVCNNQMELCHFSIFETKSENEWSLFINRSPPPTVGRPASLRDSLFVSTRH